MVLISNLITQKNWSSIIDGDEDIHGAVVVEKLQSPTAHHPGCGTDTCRASLIVKSFVVIVLIDRKHFAVDIGYEQVHPSIFIEVRGIHSHAGTSAAVGAVSHARLSSNFFE